MRLAHARPATVTLMAGTVLATAASGVTLAVAAGTAAAGAATTASGASCEPLALPSVTATPTTTGTSTTPKPKGTLKRSPSPSPAPSTKSGTATGTHAGTMTALHSKQVSLCIEIVAAQASSQRGQAAQWTVSAWATGGNVPDATLRLQATPPSSGVPTFSLGCPQGDGTSSCDLGAVYAHSTQQQLQVQLTVPVTASDVPSVRLTVTGSAANLLQTPTASSAITVTAPPKPTNSPTATGSPTPTGSSTPTGSPSPTGSPTPT